MTSTTTRNSLYREPDSADLVSDYYNEYDANILLLDEACAKGHWDATAAPTANDDSTAGYAVGSMWWDVSNNKLYSCEVNTAANAVWKQIWPVTSTGGNVDFGAYEVRAETFESDVATGTIPIVVASTTLCTDLNADRVDGNHMDTVTTRGDILFASGAGDLDRLAGLSRGSLLYEAASLDAAWLAKGAQGTVLYAGVDDPAYLAVGTKGQVLATQGASASPVWLDRTPGLYYNAIINPQFQVNQRAVATYTAATTPANSDDTYLLDQWGLLSDGNDIADVSQETTIIPVGAPSSLKLEVETQNKKFSIIQFIENKDALKFAGKSVSLQLKAYTVTGKVVENIRAAVLSWHSTADTITSDVVSAWENEGTVPTLAAEWTYENAAVNLVLVADAWTTYKIENIAIDTAAMTNLAIFIWVDDTDCAVDDLLYIGDVQINEGAVCLPFMPRFYAEDLECCLRFYEKSYDGTIAPGTVSNNGVVYGYANHVAEVSGTRFKQTKISIPSIALYSYINGTIGKIYFNAGDRDATAGYIGTKGFGYISAPAGGAVDASYGYHFVAIAEL